MLISSSLASRSLASSSSSMPPKKKPDATASMLVSPSCTHVSADRRAAHTRRGVSPTPPPAEKGAQEGMDGHGRDNQHGSVMTPIGSIRSPPRSGEKSIGNSASKEHGAGGGNLGVHTNGGPQASKSKPSSRTPSDAQARLDALVEAWALPCFPPSSSDPDIYQGWRAHVETLLDFTDGGPKPGSTRAPTVNGPRAPRDKTSKPWGRPRVERQDKTVPP